MRELWISVQGQQAHSFLFRDSILEDTISGVVLPERLLVVVCCHDCKADSRACLEGLLLAQPAHYTSLH